MPQVLGAYFEPSLGKHSRLSSDLSINQKAEMISIIIVFTKWITVRKGRWKKILRSQKFWRKWSRIPNFSGKKYFLTLYWIANNSNMLKNHQAFFKTTGFLKRLTCIYPQLFFFVFLQRKSPEGTQKKIEFYLGKNTVLDNLLLKKKRRHLLTSNDGGWH